MDEKLILLVEDNPDDEELILRCMEQNRIKNKVVIARDGVEALDFLFGTGVYADRQKGLVPELVLLDLKLPKIDGLQVLSRIRADERTRVMPVIILTSSREEEDLVDSYELGANSYICKPVDFAQFAEAIQQLKLYWLVLNEAPPAGRMKAPRAPKADSHGTQDR